MPNKKLTESTHHVRGDRTARVYNTLRDLIVRGTLAPGTRITEPDVVSRLGVSRTPVRSALEKLYHEGYVVVQRDGGRSQLAVAPLTEADLRELLYVMGVNEGLAGRYAALLPPGERSVLVRQLRKLNAHLRRAAEAAPADAYRFYQLDQDFHASYVDVAAGPRLRELLRSIRPQADRYIWVYVSALQSEILTSVREHRRIIAAIDRGKSNAAQQAVQTNWWNAAERLSRVVRRVGERGRW
ncbi:MAG: GntR family transcriptional regulator [Gemmatimonadetes bacterium]|nr:GntR family transcriptional regulator [Gemmatimonadota bacterium]